MQFINFIPNELHVPCLALSYMVFSMGISIFLNRRRSSSSTSCDHCELMIASHRTSQGKLCEMCWRNENLAQLGDNN